jgi:hypothetical protein
MFRRALVYLALLSAVLAPSAAFAAKPSRTAAPAGYDVSWPQCGGSYPRSPAFGIVGVTHGLPWSQNTCLASQYAWASSAPSAPAFYTNSANPETQSAHWNVQSPRATCDGTASNLDCAYNYGWNAAQDAYTYADAQTGLASLRVWWIDVETGNSWQSDTTSNAAVLHGMVDFLSARVPSVGFYSTAYQWGVITGSTRTFAANGSWVAGASSSKQAASWCAPSYTFTGGPVRLVQYPAGSFDGDVAC